MPIQIGTAARTLGVYLPPGYDAERAEPYKTIWMQHGGGQDQSDWMNIGSVPVIMDNLLQDGLTQPAIVVTTNTNYLGAANQGYPNLRNIVLPFVESNYNVSTQPRIGLLPVSRRAGSSRPPHQLRPHAVRVLRPVERRRGRQQQHGEPGVPYILLGRGRGTSGCRTRRR